jgi:tRNA pseudouridine55 synthase
MNQRRKRPTRSVSGWLIFDKPHGMGSTDAVSLIKRLYRADKAGHAGTLDPLATGILPIALCEATKTVPYLMDEHKTYVFTVAWGDERTTDDLEGEVTKRSDKRPLREEVEAVLPRFTGIIQQTPPQFSAVKINGERAYDIARDGERVEIASREVEILHLTIIDMPDANHTVFEVECGKGTYVRALARDMGRLLGCYGHISSLRRTSVKPFNEEHSVTQAELQGASLHAVNAADELGPDRFAVLDALLQKPEAALVSLPHIALGEDAAQRIRMGNPAIIRGRDAPFDTAYAYVTAKGKLLAIGEVRFGEFHPSRVFK